MWKRDLSRRTATRSSVFEGLRPLAVEVPAQNVGKAKVWADVHAFKNSVEH